MTLSLDTNVLVRLLTNDDPDQVAKAQSRIRTEVDAGNDFYISNLVLLETIWVLQSCYDVARENICQAFKQLLKVMHFQFDDVDVIHRFIEVGTTTNCDLSDIFIGVVAEHAGSSAVLTFDKKAAKLPMFQAL